MDTEQGTHQASFGSSSYPAAGLCTVQLSLCYVQQLYNTKLEHNQNKAHFSSGISCSTQIYVYEDLGAKNLRRAKREDFFFFF